jgi:alkylated DNA repair dioxygenase AlkB
MEYLIQTENSFLTSTKFKKSNLIKLCIEDVKNLINCNPEIIIYGKTVCQRRDVGFFSDTSIGYKYSGKLSPSISMTPNLIKLLEFINKKYNSDFNGILINRYNSGKDYISAHSDDEKNLSSVGVVAISSGCVRIFRIRNKSDKSIVDDFYTDDTHILHMGGDFQKEFTHEIPIEKMVHGTRYSFTFRKHLL